MRLWCFSPAIPLCPLPADPIIAYRTLDLMDGSPPGAFAARMSSEADFKDHLGNDGYVVVLDPNSPRKTGPLVKRWDELVKWSADKTKRLTIVSSFATLGTELKVLHSFVRNAATALERTTTCAIAHDENFKKAYGELEVLNGGYDFTVYQDDMPYLQIDGLVKNSRLLLVNRCKATMAISDIIGTLEKGKRVNGMVDRCAKLKEVLEHPDKYTCDFPELWRECAEVKGTLLPVASGDNFAAKCERKCKKLGINYVKPTGPGGSFVGAITERKGAARLAAQRSVPVVTSTAAA